MRFLLISGLIDDRDLLGRLLAACGLSAAALDWVEEPSEGARLLARRAHAVTFVDETVAGTVLGRLRSADAAPDAAATILLTEAAPQSPPAPAEKLRLARTELTPALLRHLIHAARQRTAARAQAQDTETYLRLLKESACIGTWDWDLRTQEVTWCANLYKLFGVAPSAPAASLFARWLNAIHSDDRDAAQAVATSAIAGVAPLESMFRILRPDPDDPEAPARIRWIHCKGQVLRDEQGAPIRVIGINIDVTERQEKLLEVEAGRQAASEGRFHSEMRFQTFFENSPHCMFYLRHEENGRFTYEAVNPAGLAAAGCSLEEIRGRGPEDVLGPEKGAAMMEGLRQVLRTGQPFHYEPTWRMAAGLVTYDANYMPLRDEAGRISGILGVARDITHRRQMEKAVHQLQKTDALGKLASGVAHDFNNLLANVLACFTMLEPYAASEAEKQLLAEGLRTVERGQALVQQLLSFSRQQSVAPEPLDLNAALRDMRGMLDHALDRSVQVELCLAGDLRAAIANRNQVELAILNVAINARDAMPEGGRLTIATRNVTIADRQANGLSPGDYAAVEVTDDGDGMPPEVLAHVLEPFFTTKEEGKGTGLGLSMVAGMVRQVGGGIQIASQSGHGTTVTLYFAQPSVAAEAGPARPQGSTRQDQASPA
ncbi:PAS domain-containing protein [Roseomonas sp. E05]|uniref:PAS domain-containing sensor histidine kinase n=1 Tax=Roseomonas sp. E05 TaxID=3046310 RepID=UPI0024B8EFCF|nr:PAS domain-containing protein [Roseomonas sp. E05]MDJ0389464.1 PAS domain-containing protein [Roseomonas sp. E05]